MALVILTFAFILAGSLRSEHQERFRATSKRTAQGRTADVVEDEQEQEERDSEDEVDATDREEDDDGEDDGSSEHEHKEPKPTVPVPRATGFSGVPEPAGPALDVRVDVVSEGEDDSHEEDDDDDTEATRTKEKAKVAAAKFELDNAKKTYVKWDKALKDNQAKQHFFHKQIEDLQDEDGFAGDVEKAVGTVRNETQTVHMAAFLGDMWKEMRMFAGPFFVEHLENRTLTLEREEKVIQKRFDEAKERLQEAREKYDERPQ